MDMNSNMRDKLREAGQKIKPAGDPQAKMERLIAGTALRARADKLILPVAVVLNLVFAGMGLAFTGLLTLIYISAVDGLIGGRSKSFAKRFFDEKSAGSGLSFYLLILFVSAPAFGLLDMYFHFAKNPPSLFSLAAIGPLVLAGWLAMRWLAVLKTGAATEAKLRAAIEPDEHETAGV